MLEWCRYYKICLKWDVSVKDTQNHILFIIKIQLYQN